MDKKQISTINSVLCALLNTPLRKITRAADMACFHFGDLVETDTLYRNDDGHVALKKTLASEYALHVQCCYRILCDRNVIAAKNDLFQPSSAYMSSHALKAEDAIPDDFDYDIIGNNRLDEIIASMFHNPNGFIVECVNVNDFGDLSIKFTNGFRVDVIIDVSGTEECWRFFKLGNEDHLVITGQGLAIDEDTSD